MLAELELEIRRSNFAAQVKRENFHICHASAKIVRYEDGCLTICEVRTNDMKVFPLDTRDMSLCNPQAADKIKAE
jgi:hypothetical protein